MTSFSTVFVDGTPDAQIEEHAAYVARLKNETEPAPYVTDVQALLAAGKQGEIYTKFVNDSALLLEAPDKGRGFLICTRKMASRGRKGHVASLLNPSFDLMGVGIQATNNFSNCVRCNGRICIDT